MRVTHDLQTITAQLCRFAQANLVPPGTSLSEHSLLAEVGIDSFALVELLLYSERTFGISVPESHLTHENLASLASLARCIVALACGDAPSTQAPR